MGVTRAAVYAMRNYVYTLVTTGLRLIINKLSLPGRKVTISSPTAFSSIQLLRMFARSAHVRCTPGSFLAFTVKQTLWLHETAAPTPLLPPLLPPSTPPANGATTAINASSAINTTACRRHHHCSGSPLKNVKCMCMNTLKTHEKNVPQKNKGAQRKLLSLSDS